MDSAGGDRCHSRVDDDDDASPSTSLERRSCNLPTVSAMCGPQGWADLPDALLHSILNLLVSFPDLLAFAATCHSWRVAFSSYPYKSSFSTLCSPLLIQPNVTLRSPRPRPYSSSLVSTRPVYVTSLASQNMYMCCQIPKFCCFGYVDGLPSPLDKFSFIGASYGHLILSNKQSCLVVDVFTGVSVSPPQLPADEDTLLYYGALTAPLASPNSYLIITTWSHIFFWCVGSHSWVRHSTHNRLINQVLVFKGQVFGTYSNGEVFIVHLVPCIRIQHIVDERGESLVFGRLLYSHWLVACGDMLLMVSYKLSRTTSFSVGNTFQALRLDLSGEVGKSLKVEKLENWAIFISTDEKSQNLCCMDPERWGGRSNCIYFYDSKEWIACELGKPMQRLVSFCRSSMMKPMWVVPSMFF